MIAKIVCTSCGNVLGSIEKPVITQEDRDTYQQCITCDCGNQGASLEEVEG